MYDPTRRDFLGGLSAFALFPPLAEEPDLVLHNGTVITVDPRVPRARAVAIAGDRFLAVGDDDDILHLATSRTRRIDLGGRTVVPGFIDAHTHPALAGLLHVRYLDCGLPSISEIQGVVRASAADKAAGEWVLGFKYDDTKTAEGRPLTRDDLDAAAPKHPVFILHRGGHTAYANSLALEIAGVDADTPDPEGGKIYRDAAGRATGKLAETAQELFQEQVDVAGSPEERRQGVRLISKMMTRVGVTSVHDAYGTPDDLTAYQEVRAAGDLAFRVYSLIGWTHLDDMLAAGVRTGLGDEWVKVGPVKLTCDGSISERTALLSEPYVGRPDDYGILVTPEEELYEISRKAHAAGWQIGIHSNGDVAIDIALRIYERLQREIPRRDPRFRLEHCTVINDDLIRRIAKLGAIPTPFSTYVYYNGEKMREYGAERLDRMFAVRSFLDAGIKVTQASDYYAGPFEPMMALQSSVTRTDVNGNLWGPSQRISVEEALRVGTLNGAYASFEEKTKGSISPSKLADLVVLAKDPTKVDPFELIDIQVERTMVGGRWVYES
jgi:predicted amidohydrolase YtcJ